MVRFVALASVACFTVPSLISASAPSADAVAALPAEFLAAAPAETIVSSPETVVAPAEGAVAAPVAAAVPAAAVPAAAVPAAAVPAAAVPASFALPAAFSGARDAAAGVEETDSKCLFLLVLTVKTAHAGSHPCAVWAAGNLSHGFDSPFKNFLKYMVAASSILYV